MTASARLPVEPEVADEVRGEKRQIEAIEGRDVTFSSLLLLLLAMLREFVSDPRADPIMSEWRAGLAGKAAPDGR